MKQRTKSLAITAIRAVEQLPRSRATEVLGKQLLRSATSVGANYRAACRARSAKEMIARLAVVEEEADESVFWIELLEEACDLKCDSLSMVKKECNEVVAICVASARTLRKSRSKPQTAESGT